MGKLEETVLFYLLTYKQEGLCLSNPQDKVYVGMVIGESSRPGDLDVNPLKGKQLTNMRTTWC